MVALDAKPMNEPAQTSASPIRRLLGTTWRRVLLSLILFAALTIAALPFALKAALTRWLVHNGAEQAQIERFSINPFTGTVALQGLRVHQGGKEVLTDSRFELDLGLTDLFKRSIYVQWAVYDKMSLDLEQLSDGRWRLTSYTLNPAAAADPARASSSGSLWHFLASEVLLTDCLVHLKTPEMQLKLTIERAELHKFTTRPDGEQGTFRFKGSINDAPVEMTLDTLAVRPHLRLNGSVKATGFALKHLEKRLIKALPAFSGIASIEGGVQFSLPAPDAMEAAFDGRATLADGHLGNASFSFRDKGLDWQGKVAFSGKGSGGTVAAEGGLRGEGLTVDLPVTGLFVRGETLALEGPVHLVLGDMIKVTSSAGLTLEGAEIGLPTSSSSTASTQSQGATVHESGVNPAADQHLVANGHRKSSGLASSQQGSALHATQKSIQIEGKTETTIGKNTQAGFDGLVTLAGLDLRMPGLTTADKELRWKGKIRYADAGPGTVDLDGALHGRELSLTLPDEGIQMSQGVLTLEPRVSLTLGEKPGLKGKARILAEKTGVTGGEGKETLAALEKLTVSGIEAPGGSTIAVKQVTAQSLEANLDGETPMTLRLPELDIDALACKEWSACSAQSIKAGALRANARRNSAELASLKLLAIERPQMAKDGQVTAASLQLEGLALLPLGSEKNKPHTVRLGRGRLAAPSWSTDKGFRGQSLVLEDLVAHLIRQQDGQFQAAKQLAAMRLPDRPQQRKAGEGNKEVVKEAEGDFELGGIVVRGQSTVHFEDRSLPEPFLGDAAIQTLELGGLSSRRPEQPVKVKLNALLAQRAPLEVTGTAAPFRPQPGIDLAYTLKNYPLSQVSPYTIQSVGLALASGQLNLTGSLKVVEGQLDMKNALELKKIETKTISAELAKQLDNQLPLPLESAISFLKDSSDNIKLDIPIQGPLAELDVGIGDLLITALGKAIIPAASSYLVYSLGPYGALAYVGMKVGEKIMRASLAPVVFAPGRKELTSEHHTYLERVAKVLQDRPNMDINVCPVVPAWELLSEKKKAEIDEKDLVLAERDRETLTRLGQERAQAVIDYLVSTHGIAQGRLLICETALPTDKSRAPEVELQL